MVIMMVDKKCSKSSSAGLLCVHSGLHPTSFQTCFEASEELLKIDMFLDFRKVETENRVY